jgi:hypothetical protein
MTGHYNNRKMTGHCFNWKITEHCSKNGWVHYSKWLRENLKNVWQNGWLHSSKIAKFIIAKWLTWGQGARGVDGSIKARRLDRGAQSRSARSWARGGLSRTCSWLGQLTDWLVWVMDQWVHHPRWWTHWSITWTNPPRKPMSARASLIESAHTPTHMSPTTPRWQIDHASLNQVVHQSRQRVRTDRVLAWLNSVILWFW